MELLTSRPAKVERKEVLGNDVKPPDHHSTKQLFPSGPGHDIRIHRKENLAIDAVPE